MADEAMMQLMAPDKRVEAAARLRELWESDAGVGGRLVKSNVVGQLWLEATGATASPDIQSLINRRDAQDRLVLPGVLGALSELAFIREPALVAQQLSALSTALAVAESASRPGAASHRASPERAALVAVMRWLSAVSTAPITSFLVKSGVPSLARRSLETRVDDEILVHTCVLVANIAADHADLAAALCDHKIPRLLARLVVEPTASPEAKEYAVAAANRVARSVSSSVDQDAPLDILPDALALLATCDRPACWREGVWGLHVLVTKSTGATIGTLPAVVRALEAAARCRDDDGDEDALARRVARLTLDDCIKATASS